MEEHRSDKAQKNCWRIPAGIEEWHGPFETNNFQILSADFFKLIWHQSFNINNPGNPNHDRLAISFAVISSRPCNWPLRMKVLIVHVLRLPAFQVPGGSLLRARTKEGHAARGVSACLCLWVFPYSRSKKTSASILGLEDIEDLCWICLSNPHG